MFEHTVLWRYADHLTDEEKKEAGPRIKHGLEALKSVIPGIISLDVYLNELPSSNYDIMVKIIFSSLDALNAYAVHPDHVKVKDGDIVPFTKDRVCFDNALNA